MSEYKQRLDSIMLQLQSVIEEQYEDNDYVQTAFNNLAIILDDNPPDNT
jgi:hypothetical protein